MMLFLAFLRHELLVESRSMRFGIVAAVHVALAAAPAVILVASGQGDGLGPGAFSTIVRGVHPLLAMLLAWILSVDAISRERDEGALINLALAPIGSARYVLLRWLSIVTIVLAVSAAGLVAIAAVAAWNGVAPRDCLALALPWLVEVLPVAVVMSAFALGMGTIAGNGIVALSATAMLMVLLFGIGSDRLAKFAGRRMEGPGEWLGLNAGVAVMNPRFAQYVVSSASDGPYEIGPAVRMIVPRASIMVGLGIAALCAAPLFLRRTRPDAKPWRIGPTHPLRTYLAYLKSLREHFTPDAALGRVEGALVVVGLLALVAGFGTWLRIDAYFRALGASRYSAEAATGPEPTPPDIAVRRVSVTGSLTRDGNAELDAALTIHNAGAEPAAHATFVLNQALELSRLTSDHGNASVSRQWDRLAMRFDPPIEAGGTRVVRMHVAGAPATIKFNGQRREQFVSWFASVSEARSSLWVPDFSRSQEYRSIGAEQTFVAARDLFPLARYAEWGTRRAPQLEGGDAVDEDQRVQLADIDVDLAIGGGMLLATTCGDVSSTGRLVSRCRGNLADFSIAGGERVDHRVEGLGGFLVFASHRKLAQRRGPVIAEALRRIGEQWPEMAPSRWVVIEIAPRNDRNDGMFFEANGALVSMPSWALWMDRMMDESRLAARIRTAHLMSRRDIASDDVRFFYALYAAKARLELGDRVRAALPAKLVQVPERVGAIFVDLRRRAGARQVDEAIDEFLAKPGAGTSRELFETIERRSGVSLQPMYDDFIAHRRLPNLELRNVRFEGSAGAWRVSGSVVNHAEGAALCPVVLRSEIDRQQHVVAVPSSGSGAFSFTSSYRPVLVELDPAAECFRYQPKTARVIAGYE